MYNSWQGYFKGCYHFYDDDVGRIGIRQHAYYYNDSCHLQSQEQGGLSNVAREFCRRRQPSIDWQQVQRGKSD